MWYTLAQAKGAMGKALSGWRDTYVFADGDIGITASTPIFVNSAFAGAAFIDVSLASFQTIISKINLTEHGFIYIANSKGKMLGTSSNESLIIKNATGTFQKTIQQIIDPNIATTWSLIQASGGPKLFAAHEEQGMLFQQVVYKDVGGLEIGGQTDYLGNVDNLAILLAQDLRKTNAMMAGAAVALCLVSVLMSLPMTYFVLVKPLRVLSSAMENATRFEFTALTNGQLESRSFIREFALMQDSFLRMLKNVAAAIQNSRNLANKKLNSYTGPQTTG
ncbi:hypothetical protein HK104_001656, partial [Borealophlyctis nickersoniae]